MFETLRTALSSLLANKTRSLLTMLGVVIGVGAVIAMVAVGNGASVQMQDLVSGLGSNLLILSPKAPQYVLLSGYSADHLGWVGTGSILGRWLEKYNIIQSGGMKWAKRTYKIF